MANYPKKVVQVSQNSKFRWIILSLSLSIILMVIKFSAYYLTCSNAILSDALESIINVIASGFAFYSIYLSSQPKDTDHPYGHGKIEYFSSGFEGALIIIAGVWIAVEAVQHLLHPQPIQHLDWGLLLILFTVIVNGIVGYYLQKVGKSTRSEALIADGKHLMTDSLSSVLILVGLGLLILTGLQWIDSAASLVLSLVIFYNGFTLIRGSVAALMDQTDPELLERIVNILKNHKRAYWIDVHNMRIQKYGSDLHIDCHLTLPYYWDLRQVHEAVQEFEEALEKDAGGHVEFFIHVDPCLPECCHYCRLADCPVRAEAFRKDIDWSIHNLSKNQKHFVEPEGDS
ncbi:cation diffusion facilitator family transporter [Runella slithyformis DSM 19594]|uniref:Cation diffusion facilitator family transporter n=1 Tax=Runella slithyformis (strain ATCC 29530 / DSM 19594 / LMG 11500 / NCIMB 11436 / LSU 4) TaxID=761193 RepID=A0A7U3ZK79_RUNSL|nr:cation diffusion facilitator family transporter [Runella slithyformis DSM 19594]